MSSADRSILDDYEAEQQELYGVLVDLDAEQWLRPTPAAGWDVRDSVSHLADTEEIAVDTATSGPRSLNEEAARYPTGDEFTLSGCLKGRARGRRWRRSRPTLAFLGVWAWDGGRS